MREVAGAPPGEAAAGDAEKAADETGAAQEAATHGPSHAGGRPQVYFDIEIGGAPAGKIVFEVRAQPAKL